MTLNQIIPVARYLLMFGWIAKAGIETISQRRLNNVSEGLIAKSFAGGNHRCILAPVRGFGSLGGTRGRKGESDEIKAVEPQTLSETERRAGRIGNGWRGTIRAWPEVRVPSARRKKL